MKMQTDDVATPSADELHQIFKTYGLEELIACLEGIYGHLSLFLGGCNRVPEDCVILKCNARHGAARLFSEGFHVEAVSTLLATKQYADAANLALRSLDHHSDSRDRVNGRLKELLAEALCALLFAGELHGALGDNVRERAWEHLSSLSGPAVRCRLPAWQLEEMLREID